MVIDRPNRIHSRWSTECALFGMKSAVMGFSGSGESPGAPRRGRGPTLHGPKLERPNGIGSSRWIAGLTGCGFKCQGTTTCGRSLGGVQSFGTLGPLPGFGETKLSAVLYIGAFAMAASLSLERGAVAPQAASSNAITASANLIVYPRAPIVLCWGSIASKTTVSRGFRHFVRLT